jgi:hypothetical protein
MVSIRNELEWWHPELLKQAGHAGSIPEAVSRPT